MILELLQNGKIADAHSAVIASIRERPGDVGLREQLFAVESVLGRWDKAAAQLDTLASLDPKWVLPGQVYRQLAAGEKLRAEVFAGRHAPLILGEPPAWVAPLIEGFRREAAGDTAAGWELRAQAWDAAPPVAAEWNGQRSEWFANLDLRLGATLEGYLDGQYYWIPFAQVRRLEIRAPNCLADMVWIPAQIRLVTGADLGAWLPVRYPGTETMLDADLLLARKTEWQTQTGGGQCGFGQQLFGSDHGDVALLDCRKVEFPG